MLIQKINSKNEIPLWIDLQSLAEFLHENLKPYEDTLEDIKSGLEYAFSDESGKGGFVLIAEEDENILGALVMLNTGMKGYIPENIILFVAVDSNIRGKGIGRLLCEEAIKQSTGDVCLHVEYDNPAKRLYERVGFATKYAEMRYSK